MASLLLPSLSRSTADGKRTLLAIPAPGVLPPRHGAPRIEEVRRKWPFLHDRRIDAYAGLDRRFLD